MKIEKEISSWALALYSSVKDKPEEVEKIIANLKKSLGKKKVFLPAIIKKFISIYSKENKAELVLAGNFSENAKKEFIHDIKDKLGKSLDIKESVDESLLAGFRLKTKDVLIKASYKDILQKLKNKIYGYN